MTRVWAAGRFGNDARFIIPFQTQHEAQDWIAHNRVVAMILTVYSNSRPRDRLVIDTRPAAAYKA